MLRLCQCHAASLLCLCSESVSSMFCYRRYNLQLYRIPTLNVMAGVKRKWRVIRRRGRNRACFSKFLLYPLSTSPSLPFLFSTACLPSSKTIIVPCFSLCKKLALNNCSYSLIIISLSKTYKITYTEYNNLLQWIFENMYFKFEFWTNFTFILINCLMKINEE